MKTRLQILSAMLLFVSSLQASIISNQTNTNPPSEPIISICGNLTTSVLNVLNCDSTLTYPNLSITLLQQPAHGTANVSNLYIAYHVFTNYVGLDTLRFLVCDNTAPFICDTAYRVINVQASPIAEAGTSTSLCIGDTAHLGVTSVCTYTYSWTPTIGLDTANIATPVAMPSTTTTYNLVVTDITSGCISSDTVRVSVGPTLASNAGVDKHICLGASTPIGTIADPYLTYDWIPATGIDNPHSGLANASPTSTTTYVLQITDTTTGCMVSDLVTVYVVIPPVANAGPDTVSCKGVPVKIGSDLTTLGSYTWIPAAGLNNSHTKRPLAKPAATTTYVLKITASVCTVYDTVVVTINPLPVMSAGEDKFVCTGGKVDIGTPDTMGYTYSWTPTATALTPNNAVTFVNPMITTSYILLATDTTTGCIKRDTVKVEAANLLETSAGNDVILCKGQIAAIGMPAIEGNTYTWTDGQNTLSNTNATITVQPTTTTTYYLTEVDTVKGCTSTDSVIVLITNLKGITKLQDQVLCKGTSTKVGMSSIPGYTYNWLPTNDLDDAQAASVVITPEASSTYTVSITDGFCTERDTLHVKVIQPVDLTSEETHYVCTGSNVVLGGAAVADKKYQWEPATYLDNSNTSQVIVSPQSNITYTLTVSDKEFGCEQKATIHIEMSDESFFNTFSPNGDGVNDYWHIPMLKCHPTNTVSIVSQNGEKVWEANNYDSETILWNGESMSGETLPDATYYYVIRYDQFEKRGWILIKR